MTTRTDIRELRRSHSEAELEREAEQAAFISYAKKVEARLDKLEESDAAQVLTLAKIEAHTEPSTAFFDSPTKRIFVTGLITVATALVSALGTYLANH